ncbi:MAG: cellobiose phosphorylase, partial [Spartobacteria bacterium]|nr:cellobiose phosphorylase [Spartobacteria bacterium]
MVAGKPEPKYYMGESGEFVIEQYNYAKPFASFFPGIAGPHGIPMWAFYVNRGQCVCSMGIDNKEKPIMEFLSANRAYQITSNQCFRTFVKCTRGGETEFYEPFQQRLVDLGMDRVQKMIIYPAQLTLEETNKTLGLKFTVDYFNVPEDHYAGLIRVLRIENIGNKDA